MKAKIYNYRTWVKETDPAKLTSTLSTLLTDSGFGVLGLKKHYFKPYGYSAIWLISESHLAVHTWPEEGKSYIELSSCNGKKQKKFVKKLPELFVEEDSTTTEF